MKFPNFEEDLENSEKISKIEDKVVIIRRCMKIYRIIEKNVFEKYIKPFMVYTAFLFWLIHNLHIIFLMFYNHILLMYLFLLLAQFLYD